MQPHTARATMAPVPMTPLQVRQHSLPLAKLRGYEREETDAFLRRVAADYEAIWMDRQGLQKRLAELEAELQACRDREALIADALIVAERGAAEIKAAAEVSARETLETAAAESRAMLSEAATMRRQLEEESVRTVERHEAEAERLQRLSDETRDNLSTLLVDTLHRAGIAIDRLGEVDALRRDEY